MLSPGLSAALTGIGRSYFPPSKSASPSSGMYKARLLARRPCEFGGQQFQSAQ